MNIKKRLALPFRLSHHLKSALLLFCAINLYACGTTDQNVKTATPQAKLPATMRLEIYAMDERLITTVDDGSILSLFTRALDKQTVVHLAKAPRFKYRLHLYAEGKVIKMYYAPGEFINYIDFKQSDIYNIDTDKILNNYLE